MSEKIYWMKHDGGRGGSRRPRQRFDCVVRAFALAFHTTYDAEYDALANAGRRCGRGTPKKVWQALLNKSAVRVSFPAKKGVPRVNLKAFASVHNDGRWVVQMAGHLVAVIDGIVYDDSAPDFSRCVYAAWRCDGRGAK